MMTYLDVFSKQSGLIEKLGLENAYTAWVMSLYLEDADIEALAAVALTDGTNDKKIDFIYLDHDSKRLVFAQGLYAQKKRDEAPSNKASDLNTASAWLLSGDTSLVPDNLKQIFESCREALAADEIEFVELVYLHNLPESVNVSRELQTVEEHFRTSLSP